MNFSIRNARTIVFPPAGSGSKGDEAMIKGALRLFLSEQIIIINPEERSWKSELGDFCDFREVYYDYNEFSDLVGADANVVFVGADVIDGSAGIEGSITRLNAMSAAVRAGAVVYVFFSYRSDVDSEIEDRLRELTKSPSIRYFLRDVASYERFSNKFHPKYCEFFPDLAFFSQDIRLIPEKSFSGSRRFSIGLNFSEQSFRSSRIDITDENRKNYVQQYLDVIVETIPDSDLYLISNDIRMWNNFWSDYDYAILAKGLLEDMEFKGSVVVVDPVANFHEIVCQLGKIDVSISGRMHLAIASFMSWTLPIVVTGKSFESKDDLKQRGMFDKAKGMLDWCFARPDCVVTSSEELRLVLESVAAQYSEWQSFVTKGRRQLIDKISALDHAIDSKHNGCLFEGSSREDFASAIVPVLKLERFRLEVNFRDHLKELEIRGLWIRHLENQLKQAQEANAHLIQAVSERDGQISKLSQALVEQQIMIQDLRNSRSWKITAPLRKISNMFS